VGTKLINKSGLAGAQEAMIAMHLPPVWQTGLTDHSPVTWEEAFRGSPPVIVQ
jgi:hypothetical protein